MPVKKIVVPVRGDGKGEGVLSHAARLAHRHAAHVEVVHCRATPSDLIPYGVVVPSGLREQIKAQAATLADEEEAALRRRFEELMPRIGLEIVESGVPPVDRPSASWVEEPGKQVDVIRVHGRLADVIALARPDRDANLGANSLKAALYQTGRPVLMCPPGPGPGTLGAHVAVAWNGSLEATRAAALGLGLLRGADRVTVLGGPSGHECTDPPAFRRYLAAHGVESDEVSVGTAESSGEAIEKAFRASGADMLVMGAYSHSREHEVIFGGATQHMVDHAPHPVLMTH
jgi:nucleotide-binding universal stress UspA family protein